MQEEGVVSLIDSSGSTVLVPLSFAKRCTTLANVIADVGVEAPIPTPNINMAQLKKMVDWHTHSQWVMKPPTPYSEIQPGASLSLQKKFEPTEWELTYLSTLEGTVLNELAMAANYLDMKELIDFYCHALMYQRTVGKDISINVATFGLKELPTEKDLEETMNDPEHAFLKEER
jgi:hypothetical protein